MTKQTPLNHASEDQRWRVVETRDACARQQFIYAVTTTGIYCRPGCPSPTPQRDNVRFFDTSEQARTAGFRPCKRCLPDLPSSDEPGRALVLQICQLIDKALANDQPVPTLAQLGAQVGMSPAHLQRRFKRIVGISPKAYAQQRMHDRAREALEGGATVTEAIHSAGYGASSRFYASAGQELGMAPSLYSKGGDGMRIWFTVTPCSLGWVMVAATRQGVCAVELADTPEQAEELLHKRLPQAELLPDHPQAEGWFERVVALIAHPEQIVNLPLDIRGTAFQRLVWQALRQIPVGQQLSYGELAAALGKPKAARAVASACASNHIAVAIPCHRVVRADGGLGGYRWGLERKQALLEREAACVE